MQITGSREIYGAKSVHSVQILRWSIILLLAAAKPSRNVKRKTQLHVTLRTRNIY